MGVDLVEVHPRNFQPNALMVRHAVISGRVRCRAPIRY
jgi:hypothetical protein